MKLTTCLVLVASLCVLAIGCNSIKTTALDRQQGGHLCQDPETPVQGVPVMLRVPTHLDVEVQEVEYWYPDTDSGTLQPVLGTNGEIVANRHINTQVQETSKLFFVDPKRVGSGTGIYGFTFDSTENPGKGYLKGAAYEAVDTTVQQSAALVVNIAKRIGGLTDANKTMADMARVSGVVSTVRTIAYCKFDINDPEIEDKVQQFCDMYLNACHKSCQENPLYPQ